MGLPDGLNIPVNTRMDVKAWRKAPLPPSELEPDNPRLLWAPTLESAAFERGQDENIHAVFHWEGDKSSEAYMIRGVCFNILTFAYPDQISVSGGPLNFYLNRELRDATKGGKGNFPGVTWYSPSHYIGTATFNGNAVLVFAIGDAPADNTFPTGLSLCLDALTLLPVWLDDAVYIYNFSYSTAADVQIDPQGPYLKAVQNRFGHWP